MANCISAHAVRYTDLREVMDRGVMYVADLYIDKAKVMPVFRRPRSLPQSTLTTSQALLSPIAHIPTLDTLHSLILLAWAEQKRNRMTSFCMYGEVSTCHFPIDYHSMTRLPPFVRWP